MWVAIFTMSFIIISAGRKLTELPSATPLSGGEVMLIQQANQSRQVPVSAIWAPVSTLSISVDAVVSSVNIALVEVSAAVIEAEAASSTVAAFSGQVASLDSRIATVSAQVSTATAAANAAVSAVAVVSVLTSSNSVHISQVSSRTSVNAAAIQAVSAAVSVVRTSVSVAQVALAAVSALVSANTLRIGLVSSAVSTNAVNLAAVSARVSANAVAIAAISALTSSNTVAIGAVSAAVSVNALQISLVNSAVSVNTVGIQAVSAALSVLTSAALYFKVSASAGVSQLVHSKLAERLSVKDFGAVGDGTTDDGPAIQAAINAASSVGGVVEFEAKVYAYATPLQLAGRAITLEGAGKNTFDSVDFGTVLEWTGSTSADWISISGDMCNILKLDLRTSIVPVAGHAINIARTGLIDTRHNIRDVIINNSFNGINIHGFNYCALSDVYITGFYGNYAVRMYGDSTYRTDNLFLTRVVASADASNATGVGTLFEGRCASIFGTDCYFSACNYGFHAKKNGAGDQPGAARWFRTAVENCITTGYYLESTNLITILNCFVGGCGVTSIGGGSGAGIRVGSDCRGSIVLDNNDVRTNGEAGIVVEAGAAVVDIINPHCAANSQNGFGTYPGIQFEASCSGFGVDAGRSGGDIWFNPGGTKTQSYAIDLAANTTNFNISNVNVRGNITGAINDGTTGTGYIRGCVGYVTEKSGTAVSVSTNGSGNVSIDHGLDVLPGYVNLTLLGDSVSNGVEVQAFTTTGITARVYDEATGADVTTGAFTIMWHARGSRA